MSDKSIYKNFMLTNYRLSIEKLVGSGGNWRVHYVYNNWGDNILYLLPNFCVDEYEHDINEEILDISELDFDDLQNIEDFLRNHPTTPFIVRGKSIHECADEMDKRLAAYPSDDDGYNQFIEDAEEFRQWRVAMFITCAHPDRIKSDAYSQGELNRFMVNGDWKYVYKLFELGQIKIVD